LSLARDLILRHSTGFNWKPGKDGARFTASALPRASLDGG
jgi:hypothetical protein